MPGLRVSYRKLERYAKEHGSYELSSDGATVTLVFVPTHPEVLEKGDSDTSPRVVMQGVIRNGIVEFQSVKIEDQNGVHESQNPTIVLKGKFGRRMWVAGGLVSSGQTGSKGNHAGRNNARIGDFFLQSYQAIRAPGSIDQDQILAGDFLEWNDDIHSDPNPSDRGFALGAALSGSS